MSWEAVPSCCCGTEAGQEQATQQVQLTPLKAALFAKGFRGQEAINRVKRAKMRGLIVQFMDFPGLCVFFHQLPRAMQKKLLAKDLLAPGFTGGLWQA